VLLLRGGPSLIRTLLSPVIAVVALALAATLIISCSPSDELGGVEVPNALPNTFLTAQTPDPLEASFVMSFHWDGHDPDGRIKGFQWKLSDNGPDGISVIDTLTSDPATGEILHPWIATAGNDTLLVVSADIGGYPPDADIDPAYQRAFQPHTFFVRAVDEDGGVDPTPAFVSFTATTLLPRIRIDRPVRLSDYLDAQGMPVSPYFGYTGTDPDFGTGQPTYVRFLLKSAWLGDHYVRTKYEFDSVVDQLIDFADSSWSEWQPYADDPDQRFVRFPPQDRLDAEGRQIIYLFAIQAQDTAGAVSIDRTYSRTVHNVFVSTNFAPTLTVRESSLGTRTAQGLISRARHDIIPGQSIEFDWVATADYYGGIITAYRYGWDLVDLEDPDDPGWAVVAGNTPQHRRADSRTISAGTHTFTVQVWDDVEQVTRFVWTLNVIPVPDPELQNPLLLVDDVRDRLSGRWRGEYGEPVDMDSYRDAFWYDTLGGVGGVLGFSSVEDVIDGETELISFRDLVNYRTVLWSTRYAQDNLIWSNFKPYTNGTQPYNWLYTYQQLIGNVFLVGAHALRQFIEEKNWMLPWVFDSLEETIPGSNWWEPSNFIGFGIYTQPDGTTALRGVLRYPYRAMGVSVLDHASPQYRVYGSNVSSGTGDEARDANCVGLKALLLDPVFKASHLPEGGIFPDTIFTDPRIDWRDRDADYRDHLRDWQWGNDEFYNANITSRPDYWQVQMCGDQPCLEPMFRAYTRFDWVDDLHAAAGDPDWPLSVLTPWSEVIDRCGAYAVQYEGRTAITGKTVGFLCHKLDDAWTGRRADVVWGFDPYRFNNEQTRRAIRWILSEHFGLLMSP
jgi:hypothetical protein